MEEARWERVHRLFHAALGLPAPRRHAFLESQCPGEPDLAREVEALLDADAEGATLLDRDLASLAHEVLHEPEPALGTIGPYRILATLGEGGMGVVYLAERHDLPQRVAIKVLRDASLSPSRRERFAREQRVLAQLNHPSVAALYDADTLPDGTPYFVMEHVRGATLLAHCEGHRCPIPERLRLFRAVCEAVQYAHRQAVIHRDLKPSNIMVTEAGDVKLLDFGIAKQLEGLDAPGDSTQTGVRLMTPAYAAPEQLRGGPVGIYTDVYALGVVLYELLVGQPPFDLSGRTPGEVEHVVLGVDPERPSLRARRADLAAGRQAWHDLDVLCLTAMQKEPHRRYPTVEALIRDLDRFLAHRPLEARPDTLAYRAGKFLRRNGRPVAAAALVLAVLVGLTAFYTAQLASARDSAVALAERTQRIQRFMLSLFEGGDAAAGPADSLRVLTLIDRGAREARALDAEPALQAELYHTLGGIYQGLGQLEAADTFLTLAFDRRRSLHGPGHPDAVRSLAALGLLQADRARLEEAERMARQAVELSRRLPAASSPVRAQAIAALGKVLTERGEYGEAIEVLAEAVRLREAEEPSGIGHSESLNLLANAHYYASNYAVADSLNRLVLAMDRRLHGAHHPTVAHTLVNLGASRSQLGDYGEAERLYRQALEIFTAYHGPDHHETASTLVMLGQTLAFQERFAEALAVLRPALAVRERVFGAEHPRVATTLNALGNVAVRQGDLEAAEDHFSRMIAIYRKAYGDDHYFIAIGLSNLATVHSRAGRYRRAEAALRDAVARLTRSLSADHLETATTQLKLGHVMLLQGRHAEAEVELLAGYRVMTRQPAPPHRRLRAARQDLAAVYDALGQPQKAARFRSQAGPGDGAEDGS